MDVVNVTHPSPGPAPCQMRQDVTNQFGDPLPRGQSINGLFPPRLMIFWAAIARVYSHVYTLGFKRAVHGSPAPVRLWPSADLPLFASNAQEADDQFTPPQVVLRQ